jgi:hypothetical protein
LSTGFKTTKEETQRCHSEGGGGEEEKGGGIRVNPAPLR